MSPRDIDIQTYQQKQFHSFKYLKYYNKLNQLLNLKLLVTFSS